MRAFSGKAFLGILGALILAAAPLQATDDHLLISEAQLNPSSSEFIEIANPTAAAVSLDDYYLSDDEDYALLPGASGSGPSPNIGRSDFIVRFPAGSSIPSGGVIVVALDGDGFLSDFGFAADFEIEGTDPGTPDMIAVDVGSRAGLTNGGENAVLFFWDGASDLVQDVDMVNLGTPNNSNDIRNKTGLSVDGPDAGSTSSTYLTDAFSMPEQASDPGSGLSTKRIALEGANETASGGNGITGDDETSEQIDITWDSSFTAPDPGVFAAASPPAPEIVINEVDADTPSTDTLEFVELFGPAGTALDGLVAVFFNGNGDTSYAAFDLDGFSLDANGFFVLGNSAVPNVGLVFNNNTLQNGADAVALYQGDAADFPNGTPVTDANLVDALVYDTNDSDDTGLISVLTPGQAQINEGGAGDQTGHANARLPDGGTARDTSSYLQQAPTPGTSNSGGGAAPQIVINEVDADTPSTDTQEFVELFGPAGTALDGLVAVFFNGNGDTSYAAFDLDGFSLDANGFFVLGNSAVPNVGLVFNNNTLQNGADAVALYQGDAADFPNGTPVTDANLIDALVYDTNDGDDTGLISVLTPGQAQINEGGAGDQTGHANARLPDGGTARDTSSYLQQAPTPGTSNSGGGAAPQIVINEVDADTPSTDTQEFVELFGPAGTALDGLVAVFFNGNGDTSYAAFDLDGFSLDANGFFVLGNSAVPNVGLVFNNNTLQNGADAVALYQGDGADFPNGTPVTDANLIDALVYDTNDADDTGLLNVLTPGQAQINEGGAGDQTGHANARLPDGGTARDTSSYVQQAPTPGTSNVGGGSSVIVINEVDADTLSTDTQEFVELFGSPGAALDGLVAVFYNGNGDTSYAAFDLDGFSLDAGGFFVLGNAAVPNVGLVFNNNTLQNGADAVALYQADAADFPNGTPVTSANLVDAIVYDTNDADDAGLLSVLTPGQQQVNEGGGGDQTGHANARVPDGGNPLETFTYVQQTPTPGASNGAGSGGFGSCGDPATFIHTVQGSGSSSPEEGNFVVVEAVVVGDFQDTATELSGFFLQEEDADADADATTSEGLFILDNGFGVDVAEGDVVRVEGRVAEFFGQTELNSVRNVAVCSSGAAVTPASQTLPIADVTDWEHLEGMLIDVPQTLFATENFNQGRFGEVVVSVGGRLFNPTHLVAPGQPANDLQAQNDRSRIMLDDGSELQNPLPLPPYLGLDNTLRLGDSIPSLRGALGFAFGDYRVHPTQSVTFTRLNNRQLTPPSPGGTLRVASFNVFNYFTTIDNGQPICGPSGDLGCRGADSPEEFTRQRDKIIAALSDMDADVAGLVEMENNDTASVQDLVDGLNASLGAGTYDFIDTGTIGGDAIKVALIYKPSLVTPIGTTATLENVFPFNTNTRPPLAQAFQEVSSGLSFIVVVNHFKSKGSACDNLVNPDTGDPFPDPDTGDGQGNCNLTRVQAAIELLDWLATDPTGTGEADVLIMGDLNAYAQEDPIVTLENGGFSDMVEQFQGTAAYSFVFDGQAGYLDHAMASASLAAKITGVVEWHINADEPRALDYNDFNQPLLYNPDPFRAADHDPLIVGLDLAGQ